MLMFEFALTRFPLKRYSKGSSDLERDLLNRKRGHPKRSSKEVEINVASYVLVVS